MVVGDKALGLRPISKLVPLESLWGLIPDPPRPGLFDLVPPIPGVLENPGKSFVLVHIAS
jgi:hypothetical protein